MIKIEFLFIYPVTWKTVFELKLLSIFTDKTFSQNFSNKLFCSRLLNQITNSWFLSSKSKKSEILLFLCSESSYVISHKAIKNTLRMHLKCSHGSTVMKYLKTMHSRLFSESLFSNGVGGGAGRRGLVYILVGSIPKVLFYSNLEQCFSVWIF